LYATTGSAYEATCGARRRRLATTEANFNTQGTQHLRGSVNSPYTVTQALQSPKPQFTDIYQQPRSLRGARSTIPFASEAPRYASRQAPTPKESAIIAPRRLATVTCDGSGSSVSAYANSTDYSAQDFQIAFSPGITTNLGVKSEYGELNNVPSVQDVTALADGNPFVTFSGTNALTYGITEGTYTGSANSYNIEVCSFSSGSCTSRRVLYTGPVTKQEIKRIQAAEINWDETSQSVKYGPALMKGWAGRYLKFSPGHLEYHRKVQEIHESIQSAPAHESVTALFMEESQGLSVEQAHKNHARLLMSQSNATCPAHQKPAVPAKPNPRPEPSPRASAAELSKPEPLFSKALTDNCSKIHDTGVAALKQLAVTEGSSMLREYIANQLIQWHCPHNKANQTTGLTPEQIHNLTKLLQLSVMLYFSWTYAAAQLSTLLIDQLKQNQFISESTAKYLGYGSNAMIAVMSTSTALIEFSFSSLITFGLGIMKFVPNLFGEHSASTSMGLDILNGFKDNGVVGAGCALAALGYTYVGKEIFAFARKQLGLANDTAAKTCATEANQPLMARDFFSTPAILNLA